MLVFPAKHSFSILSLSVDFLPSSESNLTSCWVMSHHVILQLPLGSGLGFRKDCLGFLMLWVHLILVLCKQLIMTCYLICESALGLGELLFVGNVRSFGPSFQVPAYFPIVQLCKYDLERFLGLLVNVNIGVPVLIHPSKGPFLKLCYRLIASAQLVFGTFDERHLRSIFIKRRLD